MVQSPEWQSTNRNQTSCSTCKAETGRSWIYFWSRPAG